MLSNPVVSRDEWLERRRSLLALEKQGTKLGDKIRAERLTMPWVKVDKTYMFETPTGEMSLSDLFDGRSQLMIYHFMFGPDWDAGCTGCSFLADHIDGTLPHLNNHDVTFVAVARAPLERIAAYKTRMGWKFPWVSSFGSDFNHDYHVSFSKEELDRGTVVYNFSEISGDKANDELPGMSAFHKADDGSIYHTYSDYARGGEEILTTMMILDRAPKGRNESATMSFPKRHDEYGQVAKPQSCCG